ncbi:hypothetical protein BH20GEM2_BH20GEM2_00370 [soil metagenome]
MNRGDSVEEPEARLERLAEELEQLFGAELRCVLLYGSAARGHFHPGASDLNVLVLLRSLGAAELRRAAPLARRWAAGGNPPPLLMSESEWRGSGDVFPIELEDMRHAHRVLRGGDPFAGLAADPEHLRLQCEHELKAKQILLRERFLLAADEPAELGRLLQAAFSPLLALFRTTLRVADGGLPADAAGVLRATGELAGFDPAALLTVLEARRAGRPLRPRADDPLVEGYLDAVARAVSWVDTLPPRA